MFNIITSNLTNSLMNGWPPDVINNFWQSLTTYAEIKHSDWLKEIIQSECLISSFGRNSIYLCQVRSIKERNRMQQS